MYHNLINKLLALVFLALISNAWAGETKIKSTVIADGLRHPWGLEFLPDGRFLITERDGFLRILDKNGLSKVIPGLPPIAVKAQGGLLDVALDPEFSKNNWVYFTYSATGPGGIGTELGRGKLKNDKIIEFEVLFRLLPKTSSGYHFGSRIVFDDKGYLYITLGDRGDRNRAQDLSDHAGSVIRLNTDGSIPADNPFINVSDKEPEIFSYGHRNPQGAAWHPARKEIWIHEHGPQGGDELNIIEKGTNYGWPLATYGKEYVTGFKIGKTVIPGTAQPVHYWVPSIAPSGMSFYQSDRFPGWNGDLLIGSLKFQELVRLKLNGAKIIKEQRLLSGELGRIRAVKVDATGYIWLLTDSSDGKLVRLEPSNQD